MTGGGAASAAVFFLFVDLGGTISGVLAPESLSAVAWWTVPSLVYCALVRTPAVSSAGGIVLNVALIALLVALFRDDSSTAGIGVLTIPFMVLVGVGAAAGAERLVERGRR